MAIVGGYGGVNIGDEMILRAVVLQARERGYTGIINVLGPDAPPGDVTAADYEPYGLRFVSWRDPFAALRAVTSRDLLIGGGQVIDGAAGVKGPAMQFALAGVARLTGGRVTIGGVSTERLADPRVRRAYSLLFRCAHRIVARDALSAKDILVVAPSATSKIETSADFVFSMNEAFAGASPAQERNVIAFAVHRATKSVHSDAISTEKLMRRLLALLPADYTLAILAHDRRESWDYGLAQDLAASLDDPRAIARAFSSADECIAFYRGVRTAISVRMHPIILAACAGSYCVPLQSSRKVQDIAERLGVAQQSVADLMKLSDAQLAAAIGLSNGGPLPEPAAVAAMRVAAQGILGRPAAGSRTEDRKMVLDA